MSLGSNFPPEIIKASIVGQLKPGCIIKLIVTLDDNQEHEKRLLVTHVDEKTIVCVVNSRIHPIIQNKPDVLRCQVAIDAAGHPFMTRDSHIDCSKL